MTLLHVAVDCHWCQPAWCLYLMTTTVRWSPWFIWCSEMTAWPFDDGDDAFLAEDDLMMMPWGLDLFVVEPMHDDGLGAMMEMTFLTWSHDGDGIHDALMVYEVPFVPSAIQPFLYHFLAPSTLAKPSHNTTYNLALHFTLPKPCFHTTLSSFLALNSCFILTLPLSLLLTLPPKLH